MSAYEVIAGEVRATLRTLGVDPFLDTTRVQSLVDEAIQRYDIQSLSGNIAIITDKEQLRNEVIAQISGYGVLQKYFDDPTVEEIWINSPDAIFVSRQGRQQRINVALTDEQIRRLVEQMVQRAGRRLDLSSPFVDVSLPGGERLHVVIPSVTREHWAVNIRKFLVKSHDLSGLVQLGTLTHDAAAFLHQSLHSGKSILVSGATHAGKTTMLNALSGQLPKDERVISCEEVFELQLQCADWVAMQTRQASYEGSGAITLRNLVKEALRMRPDRIVIGEVRQAESLDMLIALNSGIPGMATIHANSAHDALRKMTLLPLLAGENISSEFIVPTVSHAIDVVVHLEQGRDGRRRVVEMLEVPGRVEEGVITATRVDLGYTARGTETGSPAENNVLRRRNHTGVYS